jgi:hypothetical protein
METSPVLLTRNVALLVMLPAPIDPDAPPDPSWSVPPEIKVVPEYEFAPVRVAVPAPSLTKLPVEVAIALLTVV